MKKNFFAKTEAGAERSFAIEIRETNEIVLTENDKPHVFQILNRSGADWTLCDAEGHVFTFPLARVGETVFVQNGLECQTFTLQDERALRRQTAFGTETAAGRVVAPMPGRVVRVEVREGQTVAVGQALVVVEAMKMENEFKATVAGVVKKIHVREGQVVDAKAILLELE